MIAERNKRSIPYYSTGTLNELELDGYCDFGFPIGAHEYYNCSSYSSDDDHMSPTTTLTSSSSTVSSFSPRSLHFAATLPRVTSSKLELQSSHLDEVIRSFAKAFAATDCSPGGRPEIDATQLLHACRAHLELMRVGGSALCLVAKDLENNLRKAESVFVQYSSTVSSSSPNSNSCSSNSNNNNNNNNNSNNEFITLASLLEYERNTPGVHNGNILGENSAAMGLLWIRRSLAFQSHLFESLIPSPRDCSCGSLQEYHHGDDEKEDEDNNDGRNNGSGGGAIMTPRSAANEAYHLHLAPYHGWILRKVFPASLSQMPHRAVFLSKFGEVELNELDDIEVEYKIVRKLQALVSTLEPLLMLWKDSFERLNLEDIRRV